MHARMLRKLYTSWVYCDVVCVETIFIVILLLQITVVWCLMQWRQLIKNS